MTRSVTSAFLRYSTTGFDTLTATSWAAQVNAAPPSATGSANLLVDGRRVQTDFKVSDGRLIIENTDGTNTDTGPARGVLDPPALLDPSTGLPALLGALTDATADSQPATLQGRPTLRLHARLPLPAARLLLPAAALPATGSLTITVCLDAAPPHSLRQLIATTGQGSVAVTVDPKIA